MQAVARMLGRPAPTVSPTAQSGVKVYFCDRHGPWQRGTCEDANGLLRQHLPRGADLGAFSQDEPAASAASLDGRPRATRGWHTPLEAVRHNAVVRGC